MTMKTVVQKIRKEIEQKKAKSAWARGVEFYADYLLNSFEESLACDTERPLTEKTLLNGAGSWSEYAWNGCGLIYDSSIANTLCNPTELKRTKNGLLRPNKHENWLDVEARALYQASKLILDIYEKLLMLRKA